MLRGAWVHGVKRVLLSDVSLSMMCFGVAWVFAMAYLASWEGKAEFYQARCGPAVMVGLGKGFVNPVDPAAKALDDFLEQRTERLEPRELPDAIATAPLSAWHTSNLYAFYLMGFCWRIFGISWAALHIAQGLLYGLLIVAAYFLFRLGMGKPWALACSLMLLLSPGCLAILPHFRDFSKAPFLVAVFALLGYMIRGPLPRGRLALSAVLLGLVMGIGLGFRQDLISCLPPAVFLLACFLPGPLKRTWGRRVLAVVLMLASFAAAGYPILNTMRTQTANSFHFIDLGLAAPFNENLGLGDVPYMFAYHYRDEYTHAAVASYAMRAKGLSHVTPYPSTEYDRMGAAYFAGQFVRNFPGDFVARWYAAASRVLNLSPFALDASYPLELDENLLNQILRLRWRFLGWLCGWGVWLAVAALLLISGRNLRLALGSAFLLLYFGGYVSLQFMLRHYFHLEVFFWWVVGFLAAQGCMALLRLLRAARQHRLWESYPVRRVWRSPALLRALLFLVIAGGVVLAPLAAARAYQCWHVGQIYAQYAGLHLEALDAPQKIEQGSVLFETKDFPIAENAGAPNTAALATGLLAVDVEPAEIPFPIVFAYRAPESRNDFSMATMIKAGRPRETGKIRVFCPVYSAPEGDPFERHFEGVRVPQAFAANVTGLYRVPDLQAVPVLLHLTLPEDRTGLPRYLTHRWHRVPVLIREHWARRRDILEHGDFETWDDAIGAPRGALPPSPNYSRIGRETSETAHGASAVRQTWLQGDSRAPLLEHFCAAVDAAKGDTTYELFVCANNFSRTTFVLSAWQVVSRSAGQAELRLIQPEICVVPPKVGFHPCHGVLYVPGSEVPFTLVLATAAKGDATPGDTVIWDDWRLVEIEGD